MFDTALLLAHGHIGDLLAEAERERRADLIRSASHTGRTQTVSTEGSTFIRRIVRMLRAMPRVTAR